MYGRESEQRQTRHIRKRKLRMGRVFSLILVLLFLVGIGIYTVINTRMAIILQKEKLLLLANSLETHGTMVNVKIF